MAANTANTTNTENTIDSLTHMQEIREKYKDRFQQEKNDYMSMDSFFQLLLAEMSNQDPLEPTSNTEFISQLASFTSLQAQQDALFYSNANYASSLVGKTVKVSQYRGSEQGVITGTVTNVDMSDSKDFSVTIDGKSYSLKNVLGIVSENEKTDADSDSKNDAVNYDGAYATSLIGKFVTVKITEEGQDDYDAYTTGIVDAIECTNGKYTAVIGEIAHNISDVVRVEDPPEENNDNEENTGNEIDDGGIPVLPGKPIEDNTSSGVIVNGTPGSDKIDSGITAGNTQVTQNT